MYHYDVVVIGGGPSGIAAAISSARQGAKTLLVEKSGVLGGMSTGGLLNTWCGSVSSGIFDKVYMRSSMKRIRRNIYNPDALKSIYLEEVKESGAEVLLHATLCDVTLEDNNIKSISVYTKSGMVKIYGKIFIDSTGDGDLAYMSNVPYCLGRESDHLMQPLSLMFMVGGVDESIAPFPTFFTHPHLEEKMQEYVEKGLISEPAGHVILIEGYNKGTASVNMTNVIKIDGTSSWELTKAEMHTRAQIDQIIRFLKECVEGYENCYLLQSASYAGVRETRHFYGEYRLCEQDIQSNTIFDDWAVSNADFGFDNHSLTGSGSDINNLSYNHKGYTIPYRCFIPKGIDNLFLNGRNISGTHMAHSSFRVMPICFAMGEAVGTAAAMSVNENKSIREIDVKSLQEKLIANGGSPPKNNGRS